MNQPKKLVLFRFLILSIILVSCGNDDNIQEECSTPIPVNLLENCCGTMPLVGNLDNAKYFIPNMFTPNGDGINDIFWIWTNSEVEVINTFIVKDQEGTEIYSSLDLNPNTPVSGWDGTDADGNIMEGLFDVEIMITANSGQSETISSKVCSYLCGSTDFPTENLPSCGFGTQHNGEGNWDTFLPTLEDDCF